MALSISSLSKSNALNSKLGNSTPSVFGNIKPVASPFSYLQQNSQAQPNSVKTSTISQPKPSIDTSSFTPYQQGLVQSASKLAQPQNQIPTNSPQASPQGNPNFSGVTGGSQPLPQPDQTRQAVATPSQPPQPTYPGLVSSVVQNATNNDAVNKANENLKIFQTGLAGKYADTETNPIPVEFQQGREQVLARQAIGEQAALETARQNALASQAQTQTGLLGAGNLAHPITGPGGVVLDPQTGQPIGGGTGANTAFSGGQIGAQVGQGATYQNNNASIASAQGQTNQLQNLIQTAGVDPTNIVAVNNLLSRWSSEGVSSPNYIKLQNVLNGINSAYSSVLGKTVGIAQLATQSGKSIMEEINSLNAQAQTANDALKSAGTGNNQNQTNPSSTNASAPGGFGWNG